MEFLITTVQGLGQLTDAPPPLEDGGGVDPVAEVVAEVVAEAVELEDGVGVTPVDEGLDGGLGEVLATG